MVKVYIGGLEICDVSETSKYVTSQDLRELFSPYGEVGEVQRMAGKNFGFAHVKDVAKAKLACAELNRTMFKDNKLKVELSPPKPVKIYVGNLSKDTTSAELRELFEQYGMRVLECDVINKPNIAALFGFVHIDCSEGMYVAEKVIGNLNRSLFHGAKLVVQFSESREAGPSMGGPGMDGPGMGGPGMGGPGMGGRGRGGFPPAGMMRGGAPGFRGGPSGFRGGPTGLRGGPPGRGEFFDDYYDEMDPGYMGEGGPAVPFNGRGRFMGGPVESAEFRTVPEGARGGGADEESCEALLIRMDQELASFVLKDFADRLLDCRVKGELCDMMIICHGRNFPCHRLILAAKSPVMKAMIRTTADTINLPEFGPAIMEKLINFMYTGTVDVTGMDPESIGTLLSAAQHYQVKYCDEAVEYGLAKTLQPGNAVDTLIFAVENVLKGLRNAAIRFIVENSRDVLNKQEKMKLKMYPDVMMEIFEHMTEI